MFDTLLTSTPHVKSGKLRLLAVSTARRMPQHPEVPTIAEALGMKDFEASSWFALYAPAGTPAEIVGRLSAEVALALKQPVVAKRLGDLGAVPVGSSPMSWQRSGAPSRTSGARSSGGPGIKPD